MGVFYHTWHKKTGVSGLFVLITYVPFYSYSSLRTVGVGGVIQLQPLGPGTLGATHLWPLFIHRPILGLADDVAQVRPPAH